jgi:microcystin-dependent protein
MAGTLFGLPLSQPINRNGQPEIGCKLYVYSAGGFTSPALAYKDYGLTAGQEHPTPIPSDAWGRLPIFWLADGAYAFRLVDADGLVLASSLNVQALGPSSGDGGGSTVDPNSLIQTGDVIWLDTDGARSGFVRDNGRTIGSATSGATERASADCAALYSFLWANFSDTICPVTGGRGISATADFSANKPIQVPDKRGRTAFGLDDMGNSAAFRFIGVPFSVGDAITAGSLGGETAHTLTVGEMPAHDHGGATGNPTTHPSTADQTGQDESAAGSGRNVPQFATDKTLPDHVHTIPSQGGSAAHNNTPLLVVGTFYRKL